MKLIGKHKRLYRSVTTVVPADYKGNNPLFVDMCRPDADVLQIEAAQELDVELKRPSKVTLPQVSWLSDATSV